MCMHVHECVCVRSGAHMCVHRGMWKALRIRHHMKIAEPQGQKHITIYFELLQK